MGNACINQTGTHSGILKKQDDNGPTKMSKSIHMTDSLSEDLSSEDITDDRTHSENGLSSIRDASDSPTSSSESAFSQALDTLTMSEIKIIFETGDLTCIHGIDAWDTVVSSKGELDKVSKLVAFQFPYACCRNSDGASLDALTHLSHLFVFANTIISRLEPDYLQDDPLYLAQLRDALFPHVHFEHEIHLHRRLCDVFELQKPLSILEFFMRCGRKLFLTIQMIF